MKLCVKIVRSVGFRTDGKACGERAADSGSRVLITMDSYYRGGALFDHKEKADEAVRASSHATASAEAMTSGSSSDSMSRRAAAIRTRRVSPGWVGVSRSIAEDVSATMNPLPRSRPRTRIRAIISRTLESPPVEGCR